MKKINLAYVLAAFLLIAGIVSFVLGNSLLGNLMLCFYVCILLAEAIVSCKEKKETEMNAIE